MTYLLFLAREILTAAVILLPLVTIAYGLVLRRWNRFAGCYLFAVYLGAVYCVVGLPTVQTVPYLGFYPNVNLLPLQDVAGDWPDLALNVLLFVPLGFLLPLLWRDFGSFGKTLLTGFGFSLLIECMQVFTARTTDINDLITNTLGCILGYVLAAFVNAPAKLPKSRRELPLLVGLTAFSLFFVWPFADALVVKYL